MNVPEPGPRDRIVAAALSVFAERGFSAASVQQVAERAGMSKQALLHHVPSKALLRDAVYGHLALRLRDHFPAVAAELVSRDRDRYRHAVESVFHRLSANAEVSRFVVFELLEAPDQLLGWLRDEAAPWLGLMRGVADQWRTTAEDPPDDVEALVVAIATTMLAHGALVPAADPELRRRTLGAALELVLRGGRMIV